MGESTAISWTHSSWSPWHGCSRVSEGCKFCYASTFSERVGHGKRLPLIWGLEAERKFLSDDHWELPRRWDRKAARTGATHRVFCASMADVFEIHAVETTRRQMNLARARLWSLIEETPHLTWQLLTKRPENIIRLVPASWAGAFPANIWLGATTENQARYDERWPLLAEVGAAITFVSYEPALGALELRCKGCGHDVGAHCAPDQGGCPGWFPDQVIVGGESGAGRRPFDVVWLRRVADDCRRGGIALFTKQDSGARPGKQGRIPDDLWVKEFPTVRSA